MIRKYTSTSIDTTLAAVLGASATSMTVATGTGSSLMGGIVLTAGDVFTVALDPDTTSEEIIYITARSSDTFTITRGQAGTAAVVHAAGATVRHVLTSDDLNWFNNMIQSADSIGNTPNIQGGSVVVSTKIQVRKDTTTNWVATNPTLAAGEIGLDTTTGNFKIGDGTSTWIALSYFNTLPSQTGNSGKYLTTDGSSTSWASVLPSQTGNSGKYLTTDGSSASWATVSSGGTDDATTISFLYMGA